LRFTGQTRDLSVGGLQMNTPALLTENTLLEVDIPLEGIGKVSLDGIVTRVRPGEGEAEASWVVGIRFVKVATKQERLLGLFLMRKQASQRHR